MEEKELENGYVMSTPSETKISASLSLSQYLKKHVSMLLMLYMGSFFSMFLFMAAGYYPLLLLLGIASVYIVSAVIDAFTDLTLSGTDFFQTCVRSLIVLISVGSLTANLYIAYQLLTMEHWGF
jgi:hypothetical protein